jgi:hypothetical protein
MYMFCPQFYFIITAFTTRRRFPFCTQFLVYGPQEDQLKAGMQPGDPGYGEEAPELYGTLAVVANEDGSKLDISRPKTLPGCYQVSSWSIQVG